MNKWFVGFWLVALVFGIAFANLECVVNNPDYDLPVCIFIGDCISAVAITLLPNSPRDPFEF